jgi:hypothetical protein
MNNDPASLERLHDIVEPPPVPWWPPAPGWYLVIALAAMTLAWLGVRRSQHWRATAYRRAALRELKSATTPAAISELLRRTALAVAPRSTIASLTGEKWASWLEKAVPGEMPQAVRSQLTGSFYRRSADGSEITCLQEYAKRWIEQHRLAGETAP